MYEEPDGDTEGESEDDLSDSEDLKHQKSKPTNETSISSQFNSIFDEYLKDKQIDVPKSEKHVKNTYEAENPSDSIAKKYAYIDDSESEEFEEVVVKDRKSEWDCESIISTYSNLENHPALIIEPENRIKLNKRGFPKLPKEEDEEEEEENKESEDIEKPNLGVPRPKAETQEEKKQRKKKCSKRIKKSKENKRKK